MTDEVVDFEEVETLGEAVSAYPESKDILIAYLEWRASQSSESKRHAVVPHVYHASELGYCDRQLYYKHTGVEPEKEKPLGIFIMGELIEELMTTAYKWFYGDERVKKLPIKIEVDGPAGPASITGSTDCIIFDEEVKNPAVQKEIKSNARGKNAMPGYHQLVQTSVYRKALIVPENRVVHPSRNDPTNIPARDYRMTDEQGEKFYNQAIARVRRMEEALHVTKQLPMAKPPGNSQCKFCDYKERCKMDGGWRTGYTPKLKKPKLIPPLGIFPEYDEEDDDE